MSVKKYLTAIVRWGGGGGRYVYPWSEFQDLSCCVLRRMPCLYVTIVFALVFVTVQFQPVFVSFALIVVVVCHYFKAMSLVRILPKWGQSSVCRKLTQKTEIFMLVIFYFKSA